MDSVRLSLKSKTTHSTCLHVIDMALLEQVSDSQLESELSGGNNVTLDFFAVLQVQLTQPYWCTELT